MNRVNQSFFFGHMKIQVERRFFPQLYVPFSNNIPWDIKYCQIRDTCGVI